MNATAHNTELIQTLTSLDFSHVFYDTEDPVSLALACLSLTPQVLLVSYATLMLSRREMETFMMFAGQLASELLNEFIKRLIKQDRPNELFGTGYGMPSAHSQFLFFYAAYLTTWMYTRARKFSVFKRAYRTLGLFTLAVLVAYSRVYLSYHTPEQVLVGAAAGTVLGVTWALFIGALRDFGVVDWVLGWPIAGWFYIKDTALDTGSTIEIEYARWKHTRRKQKIIVKAE